MGGVIGGVINSFLNARKAKLSNNGYSLLSDIESFLSPFLLNVLVDRLLEISFPFPFKIIANSKHGPNIESLVIFYKALVRSRIDYGIFVFGSPNQT